MGGVGSGKKPREYPREIVDQVISLYESGATVAEVQKALPPGFKAQRIIERYMPIRRRAIKRDQTGAKNHMWKGDGAAYTALHLRVATVRGKPRKCSACETTEGRFEWANMTGNYADPFDYVRLCTSCHRRIDVFRRKEIGRTLSGHVRKEVMPNV